MGNTARPPSSTSADQGITPSNIIPAATKELEAVKEARVKILFALDDMVRTTWKSFRQTTSQPNPPRTRAIWVWTRKTRTLVIYLIKIHEVHTMEKSMNASFVAVYL